MLTIDQKLKKRYGFTIVELLIVIVVIAILAAITVVAYNGIQDRTKQSATVSAIQGFVKLIKLYRVDNGQDPAVTSCIGTGYPSGKCRTESPYAENGGNLNSVLLKPYLTGAVPTPTMYTTDFYGDGSLIITGAFYVYNNGSYNPNGGGIGLIVKLNTCPDITGLSLTLGSTSAEAAYRLCRYAIV